jgi:hypothetical protein
MQQGCQIRLLAVPSPWHMRTSLTNRSTRTPTLAIASRRPMLVPYQAAEIPFLHPQIAPISGYLPPHPCQKNRL